MSIRQKKTDVDRCCIKQFCWTSPSKRHVRTQKTSKKLYLCGPQTLWLFWQVAIHCCLVDQLDELFAFQRQFADISNTCQKAMEIHPVHLTPLCCKCLCSILQRHLEKSGVEICSVIVQLFESLINRYNIYIYIDILQLLPKIWTCHWCFLFTMWTRPDTFSCSMSILANSSNKYMLSLSNFIPRWYCSSTMRFTSQGLGAASPGVGKPHSASICKHQTPRSCHSKSIW